MASDIKLDETMVTIEAFSLKVQGADLLLDLPERRGGAGGEQRRALVHGPGDVLTVNWSRDYTGGVQINGKVSMPEGLSVPVRSLTPILTGTETVNLGDELFRLRSELAQLREQLEDLQIRATITAEAKHYTQAGWRGCERCSNLTFAANQSRGVCPTDKKPHGVDKGARFILFVDQSRYATQAGWGWCHKCQGLAYGTQPLSGHCPAGGSHDRARSPSYLLWAAEAPQGSADAKDFRAQEGWRRCNRCQGLVHGGTPASALLPAVEHITREGVGTTTCSGRQGGPPRNLYCHPRAGRVNRGKPKVPRAGDAGARGNQRLSPPGPGLWGGLCDGRLLE
ncbi:hypothetical protein [Hyalangium sp.]|uniref:hypothetical protein n=1 Tax=Hyalangium sp. TaxID=2028555 RepID=UPI002D57056E|nr:hypothetical protein [Hyalangium sp.]HYI01414.1 hypothetical protein [Hyalangium sp.]